MFNAVLYIETCYLMHNIYTCIYIYIYIYISIDLQDGHEHNLHFKLNGINGTEDMAGWVCTAHSQFHRFHLLNRSLVHIWGCSNQSWWVYALNTLRQNCTSHWYKDLDFMCYKTRVIYIEK